MWSTEKQQKIMDCRLRYPPHPRPADTETDAYTLDGASSGLIARNPNVMWWLPSEDEW